LFGTASNLPANVRLNPLNEAKFKGQIMKTLGVIMLATVLATGAATAQGSGGGGSGDGSSGSGNGGTESGPSGTSTGKEAGSKGR
jgi:hypothetical protein